MKWGIKAMVNAYNKIEQKIYKVIGQSFKWTYFSPERFFLIYGGLLLIVSIRLLKIKDYIGDNEVLLMGWLFMAIASGASVVVSLAMYAENIVRNNEAIRKIREKISKVKRKLKQTEEEMLAEKKIKEKWRIKDE
jgi:choline-glycine betaine transporter